MGPTATAILVFKVLTIVTTVLTRLSLLPDFQRMHKTKSTGNMSVLPCVFLYANCYLLCWYSVAVDLVIPLFLTSSLGVVVGGALAVCFYLWCGTNNKRHVRRILLLSLLVMALETIYGVLALRGWTHQDRSSTSITLGILLIVSSVGYYASPMATIRDVIRTKTSSSMPFTMGVVNVLSSGSWVIFGILVRDIFLVIPNACGAVLGMIQLILTCLYPRQAPSDDRISALTTEHCTVLDYREPCKSNVYEAINFTRLQSPTH